MNLTALKTLYLSEIRKEQLSLGAKNFDVIDKKFLSALSEECRKKELFEVKGGKAPFQQFWEDYIALFLTGEGIELKRDKRDAAPDYYFEFEGKKVHIEVKAPNDADDNHQNLKTKEVCSFNAENGRITEHEEGFAQPNNALLRFTGIIDKALSQINGSFSDSKAIAPEDYVILAVNGHEVVKNTEYLQELGLKPGCFAYHLVCSVLGKNGEQSISVQSGNHFMNTEKPDKNGKPIDNRYFCRGNKTPIDGILYSNVHIKAGLHEEKFVFIPNSERRDLRHLFPFCI